MTEDQKQEMNRLYTAYELTKDNIFKHKNYAIITRQGIEKIQAIEGIEVTYDVIECTPNFAAVRASVSSNGKKFETFASALKGASYKDGNTQTWYVLEIAEKRALSRAVLRAIDLYKHGFFAEDESEEFQKP